MSKGGDGWGGEGAKIGRHSRGVEEHFSLISNSGLIKPPPFDWKNSWQKSSFFQLISSILHMLSLLTIFTSFFVQLTETNFQLWLGCAAHISMENIKSKPIYTIAHLIFQIQYNDDLDIRKPIPNYLRARALQDSKVFLNSNLLSNWIILSTFNTCI